MLDVVLTIINVILAVVSAFGAWNSIKYFRKRILQFLHRQTKH